MHAPSQLFEVPIGFLIWFLGARLQRRGGRHAVQLPALFIRFRDRARGVHARHVASVALHLLQEKNTQTVALHEAGEGSDTTARAGAASSCGQY